MKVSIDGILGSARRINNQRQTEEENLGKGKKQVKSDSVAIGSRVNSRLDAIEAELRAIQSSLTSNQIIRAGVDNLQQDLEKGGENRQAILAETTFEGARVLDEFVGPEINPDLLNEKATESNKVIASDADKLKRFQVEVENLMASNLAGTDRAENVMSRIETVVDNIDSRALESISTLRPDTVARLIK